MTLEVRRIVTTNTKEGNAVEVIRCITQYKRSPRT